MIHSVIQPTTVWSFRPTKCVHVCGEQCVWKKEDRLKIILRAGRLEMREKPKYIWVKTEEQGEHPSQCVCVEIEGHAP